VFQISQAINGSLISVKSLPIPPHLVHVRLKRIIDSQEAKDTL